MFSKEKAKDVYRSYKEFNDELNNKKLPTGDKEVLQFAGKLRKKTKTLS